jgi:hypothetical protein
MGQYALDVEKQTNHEKEVSKHEQTSDEDQRIRKLILQILRKRNLRSISNQNLGKSRSYA